MRPVSEIKAEVKTKCTSLSAWKLKKEDSSCAPDGINTNIDNDVTPPSRRTWNMLMIAGFWASDYLSMQSVQNPASSLTYGMTWRTALITSIVGMLLISVPLILNGAIGARYHIPFPVSVRSSFGYHFAKFPIITRLVTCVFWASLQTFTGSLAMARCLAAIWPSFDKIHNAIPESMGVTSSEMVAHFVFWSIQLPFLLIPPHKLRWFFVFKTIVVSACLIGTAAGMSKLAGGSGDIWDQKYTLSGSERSWTFVMLLNSSIGGWATMATNISDFTRFMTDKSKGQYAQVVIIPAWSTFVTMMALTACSAGFLVYGEFIWSPTDFALYWTTAGSKGRAAAFFVGASWCVAQIGTNLSANVVTGANDLCSLLPGYFNIRRGAFVIAVVSGWILPIWKIQVSASSLISFISGLSCFLAPITGIMVSDYWLVKKQKLNVPALYDPNGIYRYYKGFNWRAIVSFLVANVPTLPGMASDVNSKISVAQGMLNLWHLSYFYGFLTSLTLFYVLNLIWPAHETLIESPVYYFYDTVEEYSSSDDRGSFEEVVVDVTKEKAASTSTD